MQFMLLIVEPVGQRQARGPDGGRAVYASMLEYTAALQQRGQLVASNSLAGTESAARLQLREGRVSVVDGPFAETKEMVGGLFLVEVAGREEALALAAECPAAAFATVAVRALAPCYA